MTQCQVPPLVLPTWLRSYFFHSPVIGLNASVVPGSGAAPILPCTFEVFGSCARVGRSPQVGSVAECPARNRFQPWPSVQADLLLRTVGEELHIVLQRPQMALGVDQGLHRLGIEEIVLVVRRDDERRRERQEVEESLLVDLGVQRNAPVVLAVAVPVPAGEEIRDVVIFLGSSSAATGRS